MGTVTILITQIRGLITPPVTTYEPPSTTITLKPSRSQHNSSGELGSGAGVNVQLCGSGMLLLSLLQISTEMIITRSQ